MCSQDMSVNAFKCLFLVVPLGWFWPKAGLATDELGPRNEDGCHSHGHSMLDWWICFSLFKKTVCIICFVLWVSILAVLLAWQKFLHCSIFWGAGTAGCLSLDTGWVPSVAAQLHSSSGAMEVVIVHEASGLIAREHASALQAPIGAFEFFERWMLKFFFLVSCMIVIARGVLEFHIPFIPWCRVILGHVGQLSFHKDTCLWSGTCSNTCSTCSSNSCGPRGETFQKHGRNGLQCLVTCQFSMWRTMAGRTDLRTCSSRDADHHQDLFVRLMVKPRANLT